MSDHDGSGTWEHMEMLKESWQKEQDHGTRLTAVPERPGSPPPPRDFDDDLIGLEEPDAAEDDDPTTQVEEDIAHGLDYSAPASGTYTGNKQDKKIPDGCKPFYWDLNENEDQRKRGVGNFYGIQTDGSSENLETCIEILMRDPIQKREREEDPPVGSWSIYLENFQFVDGGRECEIRFNIPKPCDGLSREGTTGDFGEEDFEIVLELGPHRAGARSWRFKMIPFAKIIPELCKVKVYPKKERVKVCLYKAEDEMWPRPGQIVAPTTKKNYRDGLNRLANEPGVRHMTTTGGLLSNTPTIKTHDAVEEGAKNVAAQIMSGNFNPEF